MLLNGNFCAQAAWAIVAMMLIIGGCRGPRPVGPPPDAPPLTRDFTRGEAPEDHTLRFRRHHAEAASSADAKCGDCHTGLSAARLDTCQDCHAVWRPRSHTVRWRGAKHGRAAARDPTACATCHEVDTCTACHSVPPPSHSPLVAFRARHQRAARQNPRACMTCHTVESSCARCHNGEVSPFGRLR